VTRLEITVPEENVGRVINDLNRMGGSFEPIGEACGGMVSLSARAPAAACASWGRELRIFTRGRGQLISSFDSWQPCADAAAVIAKRGYDPRGDVNYSPDSVFCSHGAGYTVPWNEVEQHMHLPSWKEIQERRAEGRNAGIRTGSAAPYRGTAEEDAALEKIFERTYGPARARQLIGTDTGSRPPDSGANASGQAENSKAANTAGTDASQESGANRAGGQPPPEILLIDGYNVLYAWEEWKPLLDSSLENARMALADLLCNYAGATGHRIILVFDAYRVPGQKGSAEKYRNIFIIYTRQAQTADAFIEQSTYVSRNAGRIRVVTSDRPEQLIAAGNAAMRTSAREFRQEVIRVKGSIAAYLEQHYRPGTDRALERAYKEAWKKAAGAKTESSTGTK
jgi:predicted RNA-binding protein with PIN domain